MTTPTSANTYGEGEIKIGPLARYTIEWLHKHIYVEPGVRINLADYQIEFIARFQATAGDDYLSQRLIRRAILSVGRKNGKTSLAAALLCFQLSSKVCPFDVDSFFASGGSKDQSALGFDAFVDFVARNPKLEERWSVNPGMRNAVNRKNLNRVEALGTNNRSLQGRLCYSGVFDELAEARSIDLLDTMERSQTKNAHWLIVTSTMNDTAGNPLSDAISMTKQGHDRGMMKEWMLDLHFAPPDADIYADESIRLANPGLRGNPPLIEWSVLTELRDQAKLNPSKRTLYKVRTLNQESTAKSPLVDLGKWKSLGCTAEERMEYSKKCATGEVDLGLDLSTSKDLTSLAAYYPEHGYLETTNWIPGDEIRNAEHTDKMSYRVHITEGWLNSCPGPIIDYEMVVDRILWYFDNYKVRCVRYDPHKISLIRAILSQRGIDPFSEETKKIWVPVRQGILTFTGIISKFEAMVEGSVFKHEDSPILNAAINGCQISHSTNLISNARMVTKASRSVRTDAAIASLMAMTHEVPPETDGFVDVSNVLDAMRKGRVN